MNSLEKNEQELIVNAQSGDGEAMAELLERYKSMVRALSRPLFLIDGDQDDLIQEGMIGLYKAIQTYDAQRNTSFDTFANLCIRSQLHSAIKASNRKKNIPLNSYVSFDSTQDAVSTEADRILAVDASFAIRQQSPEDIVIGQENAQSTQRRLFSRLSKMEKQVLNLFLRGQTYQEIAQELEKSPKAIDNALQRIKTKLSKMQRRL